MTIKTGRSYKSVFGRRVDCAITYNHQATDLGDGGKVLLPLTEPTNPQVTYTLSAGLFPVFTYPPYSVTYAAMLVVWGGNGDASNDKNLYVKPTKNGSVISTVGPTLITKAYHYTVKAFQFPSVVVGDVIGMKLYGSTAINYRGYACLVYPTQIHFHKKPCIMKNLNITYLDKPAISVGTNPVVESIGYNRIQLSGEGDNVLNYDATTPNIDFFYPSETYGLTRCEYGDILQQTTVVTHTTAQNTKPYYKRQLVPINIKYQAINIHGLSAVSG